MVFGEPPTSLALPRSCGPQMRVFGVKDGEGPACSHFDLPRGKHASRIFSHSKGHPQPKTASLTRRDRLPVLGIQLQLFLRNHKNAIFPTSTATIPHLFFLIVTHVAQIYGLQTRVEGLKRGFCGGGRREEGEIVFGAGAGVDKRLVGQGDGVYGVL